MTTVGLRELRQRASELVREAEAGGEVTITVAGRPSVRLTRVPDRQWRTWSDIAELFDGPGDPDWEADRDLIDGTPRDPWER